MKKIIVAGAGHGGLVAAAYLAKEGFDITVFEKKQENELGYDQFDSVHLDGFELAGLRVPEEYKVKRTGITFVIPGTDIPPVNQGVSDDRYNVEIDRKALYRYLIAPAKEAGVNFRFGCEVFSPIIFGSRVCGIKTSDGDFYADMVIDACGLYSPVRSALPEAFGVQNSITGTDIMRTYRAFYKRNAETGESEHKYVVSLLPGEFCGIMWAITKDTEVDILIASMTRPLSDEDIAEKTEMLKNANPVIGEFIRGGRVADIPVRAPLGMLVADGYAAIGDAAFMTVPLKGSGVGYSMRAGKILAETVIADENGFYTRETLWKYQTQYYDQMGFGATLIAVIKNELPFLAQDDLEYFFRENIITPDLLESFGNEAKFSKIISSIGLKELREKARKVVGHPYVRSVLLRTGKNITRAVVLRQSLKDKYETKSAAKWIASYNGFLEGMLREAQDEKETAEIDN
ncbi:MAG: NAD(P)/FAD-dependent oxidoreductase [Oscillospiraceae bacterium]|nr:NAD(P)/FAD-dependent oxidoreductase [Oscillospiraceae bacterium]